MIVHINSPGGTVAGSEELYDSLIRLKAKKPMVVVVDGLAASGGYIAAMASDHILAQQSSIVGSIGVIFQYPNFTDLLKTIGVQVESIKSSPLKAAPNGLSRPAPRRARRSRRSSRIPTPGSRTWCATAAASIRPPLDKVADGRVFTGRQALELKLIDALGDEQAAVDWLAKGTQGTDRSEDPGARLSAQPAVQRPAVPAHAPWSACSTRWASAALAERFKELGHVQAVERLNLDGLLALWHPPTTN